MNIFARGLRFMIMAFLINGVPLTAGISTGAVKPEFLNRLFSNKYVEPMQLKQLTDDKYLHFAPDDINVQNRAGAYAKYRLTSSKFHPKRFHTGVTNLAPEVNKLAPNFNGFAVVDGAIEKISLSDYRGKHVILFFYPFDFAEKIPGEITLLNETVIEFRAKNTEIIAASSDSHHCHLAWIKTPREKGGIGPINIPLLSDFSLSIAKDYGIQQDSEFPLKALFLIDHEGILKESRVSALPDDTFVDEIINLIRRTW